MQRTIRILDIPIAAITMQEAVNYALSFSINRENKAHTIMTPNAEIVMRAQKDEELKEALLSADLLIPDGSGLVWASKSLGKSFPERVAGIDLMSSLLGEAAQRGYTVYFLGAKEKVVRKAKKKAEEKWPGLVISGFHHGYFSFEDNEKVVDSIHAAAPDILFVGMGAPRQEKWIAMNQSKLHVPLVMGVGGSFDVISDKSMRAPIWMQKIGMEWFFRLIKEPKRIKRMAVLPLFVLKVWGMSTTKHGGKKDIG